MKGSPYSLDVQLDALVARETRTPLTVQLMELAWCVPTLWPSSCDITRRLMPPEPLSQEYFPGMYASPDQPQLEVDGNP